MSYSHFENKNNPYAPVTPQWSSPNGGASNKGSTTQFTVLGILFLLLALVGLAGSLLTIAGVLTQYASGEVAPPPNADKAQQMGFWVGYWGFFSVIVASVLSLPIVAIAGINMLRLKGLVLAKFGAVLLCIPGLTSCCILGVPFGIWAIIVLNGESAKQNFS
jgi:hypothetical protein